MEGKRQIQEESAETLVRIAGHDIFGSKNVDVGLTRIRGVGWSISNALCVSLGLDKRIKISELSKEQIKKIENWLKNVDAGDFLKNRRKDLDSGESKHLVSSDLDIRKEFDIKRLKKIKSYVGVRHTYRLPVRGQRTRSHFRKTGIAVGVKKPKVGKKS